MQELPCEVCGWNLATDVNLGWLRWVELKGVVVAVQVCCHGARPGGEQCCDSLERRDPPEASERDGHLEWFTGAWALRQCWRMLRHYQWTNEAAERLFDILDVAQQLPTGSGPPSL